MLITGKEFIQTHRKHLEAAMLFMLVSLLALEKLAFYVRFDFNFILLLLVLPFVLRQTDRNTSNRYAMAAMLLFIVYYFVSLSTIYFFAWVCSLFFLYESNYGKLSAIPLFLVMVVSPIAIYFTEITGFEIRLILTGIAAEILHVFDAKYSSRGNVILYGENAFTVDPECMGLSMVLIGFFITLIFISVRQRKNNTRLKFSSIVLLLALSFLFNILSNICRIVLITLFQSPPSSLSHEMIGVICFLLYVVIPLWFISGKFKGKPLKIKEIRHDKQLVWLKYLFYVVLLTALTIFCFNKGVNQKKQKTTAMKLSIPDHEFDQSVQAHGVLKLYNQRMLVYIKPSVCFYTSEHTPLICWKGSGYKIVNEQKIKSGEHTVYYGELIKGNEKLFTTWWYDSGEDKTVSQFIWRSRQFMNLGNYRLINVICASREELLKNTSDILQKNLFEN